MANKADAHSELFEGANVGEVRRLHQEGYDPDNATEARARSLAVEARHDLGGLAVESRQLGVGSTTISGGALES